MKLHVYGEIDHPLTSDLVKQLHAQPNDPATVYINSPGGLADCGLAIYNALAAHRGKVTLWVEGICASAATLLCCAGHAIASSGTVFGLHDPRMSGSGNAKALREWIDALEKYSEAAAKVYAAKTRHPVAEISAYLKSGEIWLSPEEAQAWGLVDEIAAHAPAKTFCLGSLKLPERFIMPTEIAASPAPALLTPTAIAELCLAAGEPALGRALLNTAMTTEQVTARLEQAKDIRAMASRIRLDAEAEPLILAGIDPVQAGKLLWTQHAERDEKLVIDNSRGVFTTTPYGGHGAQFLQAASDALSIRMGAQPKAVHPAARDFENTSLTGMAALCLSATGQSPIGMSRPHLVKMAMTASDFPHLLSGMASKTLTDRFEVMSQQHRVLCDKADLPDFKQHEAINVSFLPGLELKKEAGEIRYGKLTDSAESYKLATYARGLMLSRESIINDDLGAFAALINTAANAAARLERDLVFSVLTANAAMSDGTALFHADHGNLDTSSAAMAVAGLNAARVLMRKQQDVNGGFVLTQPQFIVCPVALEGDAEALVTSLTYRPSSNVEQTTPQWVSQLTVVSDPRLDASDAADWYLLSDPRVAPVIRLAYLNGITSPEVDEERDFERDVLKYKVRFDVACAAIGWAGAVKMA